jgi:hypothetical protein
MYRKPAMVVHKYREYWEGSPSPVDNRNQSKPDTYNQDH